MRQPLVLGCSLFLLLLAGCSGGGSSDNAQLTDSSPAAVTRSGEGIEALGLSAAVLSGTTNRPSRVSCGAIADSIMADDRFRFELGAALPNELALVAEDLSSGLTTVILLGIEYH